MHGPLVVQRADVSSTYAVLWLRPAAGVKTHSVALVPLFNLKRLQCFRVSLACVCRRYAPSKRFEPCLLPRQRGMCCSVS
jgi:hypothetical protein